MEKTFVTATLIFGAFIALSLAVFAFFAFRLGYPLIGTGLIAIFGFSAALNIVLYRKWK
ncbi:MAG TPA: hypothetical protein VIG80_07340 [Bacillaceae bacterium]